MKRPRWSKLSKLLPLLDPAWWCQRLGHPIPRPLHPPAGLTLTLRCPRCGQLVTYRT